MFKYILTYLFRMIFIYKNQIYQYYQIINKCIVMYKKLTFYKINVIIFLQFFYIFILYFCNIFMKLCRKISSLTLILSFYTLSDYDIYLYIYTFVCYIIILQTILFKGFMDSEPEVQMKIPRCGNHDNNKFTSLLERVRRYVLIGRVWNHMNLTFKINKYSK